MNPLKEYPGGTKLDLNLINGLVRAINRAGIVGGQGLLVSSGFGGQRLALDPGFGVEAMPVVAVNVINRDASFTIPPGCLAGIIDGAPATDEDFIRSPLLNVRRAKSQHAGNFVIVENEIKVGQVGRAFIGGCCYCRVLRWFDSDLLDTVDVLQDQTYGLVTAGGSLDILWEQRNDDGSHIVDEEHWALVCFNRRRFIRYRNDGSTTIGYGEPIAHGNGSDEGVDDGGAGTDVEPLQYEILDLQSLVDIDAKSALDCLVNLGGDVAAGDLGRAGIPSDRPFLLSIDDGGLDAQADIGASHPTQEFSGDGQGYVLLANLGDHDGKHWGIARISGGISTPHMTIRITGGNTLVSGQLGIINLVSELTEVASLWDPTDPGTKEDGIGTGILYVNGINKGSVLVVNDGRAGIAESLVETWRVQTVAKVTLPLTGDPTQTVVAYIPSGA